MCFRSRSGSVSSTANGRRITRRRGRRGLHQSLSMSEDIIDHDHNHNDSYYTNDHDGNGTDMKIVPMEHSDHGGSSAHGYQMVEAEYDHHPHSHHSHASHHPHHHSQHHGLVHMAVNLADSHHHIISGANNNNNNNDSLQPQDPHVPVVTYRSRDPGQVSVTASTSTVTRNDSSSNLNSLCLAASAAAATPEKQQQVGGGGGDEPRGSIPAVCNCKCRSSPPQTIGDKVGRLVEETFNNLHPEYHEMARWEIQQILGKYLQKPIP